MTIELRPFHADLTFMSPLSDSRAAELVGFLAQHARGNVVDIGCGWAALLTQLLVASSDVRGLGIDLKPDGFEFALQVAQRMGVADRLELIAGDASLHRPAVAQGAICIGASQAWRAPTDVVDQPLDYAAALTGLRRMVQPGAPVVYGEAIWSAAPTAAAVAPLAGRLDEFMFLPDLIDLAWASGFAVVQVHQATLDEWDRFESGYTARYAQWLAAHGSNHPGFDEVRSRALRQRDAYFRGYRGILGMAYLALLAM